MSTAEKSTLRAYVCANPSGRRALEQETPWLRGYLRSLGEATARQSVRIAPRLSIRPRAERRAA